MREDALETELVGDKVIKVYQDYDPESPREWDNLGTMLCWHRRANLGDETVLDRDELEARVKAARVVLPLWLYEHGGMTMRCGERGGYPFTDAWDSGQVGFILVDAETIRRDFGCKHITKKVMARVEASLRGEVEVYDQWLRGDVYGYVIEDQDGGEEEDSCWGFYGMDECLAEARGVVEGMRMREVSDAS